jgi:hypothetical protein
MNALHSALLIFPPLHLCVYVCIPLLHRRSKGASGRFCLTQSHLPAALLWWRPQILFVLSSSYQLQFDSPTVSRGFSDNKVESSDCYLRRLGHCTPYGFSSPVILVQLLPCYLADSISAHLSISFHLYVASILPYILTDHSFNGPMKRLIGFLIPYLTQISSSDSSEPIIRYIVFPPF